MKVAAFVALAAIVLVACTPNIDPASYSVGGVGIANRSVAGVVVSATPVVIDLSNEQAGQGGMAGAIIGSAANSGTGAGGKIAAALIGAAVGAAIGASVEDSLRTPGHEYIVETASGARIRFIQSGGERLSAGTRVIVFYGPPPRLVAQ